jgi:hypothetical protein
MPTDRLPSFGDVIMSQKFVFGHINFNGTAPIQVGGDSAGYKVNFMVSEAERVTEAAKTGKILPKSNTVDLGRPDLTRAAAEFVVIDGRMQGGGTGHGPNDIFPDGWHVVAKRLDVDGLWDPEGEEIAFYMTGCFIDMISPEEVRIVRHMEMSFT